MRSIASIRIALNPKAFGNAGRRKDSPAGKVKAVHAGPVKYGLSERDECIQKSGFELAA